MGYGYFSDYYDILTLNIDYRKRAEYFSKVFKHFGSKPEVILDLACGTGNLTFELAKLGYDMIGSDSSEIMLEIANEKKMEYTRDILFIHQPMQKIELYNNVDGIVCALDSINHLQDENDLDNTFAGVSEYLVDGGLFIFDVNTEYKHREVLGDNCFVYELEDLFCVWQNTYHKTNDTVEMQLDFFSLLPDGNYFREEECFCERIFRDEIIRKYLDKNSLEVEAVFGEDSFSDPIDTAQRLIYVAKKKN